MFARERDKNELPDTIMAFHNDSFQILKSHCLLESSVPLPWQPNLIKTLATGAFIDARANIELKPYEACLNNLPAGHLKKYN